MKSIQKCDCNYLARFAVSDSFIRDNSFRGLLAIFMVTIFVPGTAFSELYVNNANDPGCYAVVDDNNLNFKGRITGIVTNHIYCNTLTEANLNTNGGSYLLADKAGSQGTLHPWTGTFTTAVGTSNVATAYGFVVQKNGAFINGDTYVQGGYF